MQNFYLFIILFFFLLNFSAAGQTDTYVHKNEQVVNINVSKALISKSIISKTYTSGSLEINPSNPVLIEHGLIFSSEFSTRLKNSSNTEVIQLKSLSDKAQALQFRLQVNKEDDDSTFILFENIQKGSDVSDTSWTLVYNIIRGQILPNGASKDEIIVLLYNQDQNGGLNPGDYNDLLRINYKVTDIPEFYDSLHSSMKITNTTASNAEGFPIDITPSRNELKIYVLGIIPKSGLVFEEDTVYRLEDDSYVDIIQLTNLEAKTQAIQFRLLVNKAIDDNVILTFQSLQKGENIVDDPSWVLDYNVIRGPLTGNGASVDEIYVLIQNLNLNNGLNPGNYNDLLRVKYRISNLPALQDSIKSSIKISNAEASTYQGFPVDITPSRDELTVIARNRVGFYGDVNGDGCLDILDIIMIVDHIIGKDSLDNDQFERADIAPWTHGNANPDPDGIVNVQDLSILQNIILSGIYPDGTPINGCSYTIISKLNSTGKVKFYITNNGITAFINTEVEIRGVQLEFGEIIDDPNNMTIATDLGQGYYFKGDEFLRVLLYDRMGQQMTQTGEQLLADMPFHISNPRNITLKQLILIDKNRQKIIENQVEIIYGPPPSLPTEYILFQNYPNPFNPNTTIKYSIPEKSKVSLTVYDILGNEISELVNEEQNRGEYNIIFNGFGLASGVYFYRIQAGSFIQTKKMLLMK